MMAGAIGFLMLLDFTSVTLASNGYDEDQGRGNGYGSWHSFCDRGGRWDRFGFCKERKNEKPPLVYLFATKYAIRVGKSTTLYWDAKRADSCSLSGGGLSGTRAVKAEEAVSPTITTEYTITCLNEFGSYVDSATITVKGNIPNEPPSPPPAPTLSFNAVSTEVVIGNTTELSWSSTNANACEASNGWIGNKSISGNELVTINATTTYALLCGNGLASTSQSVTVNAHPVQVQPPPTGHVVISEVFYLGASANEWVELFNGTGSNLLMEGWTISDAISSDLVSTTTIPSGNFAVIVGSTVDIGTLPIPSGTVIITLSNSTIGSGLNDSVGGDSVILRNGSNVIVDQMSYGSSASSTLIFDPNLSGVAAGHSLRRIDPDVDTDTAADWEDASVPSPGE